MSRNELNAKKNFPERNSLKEFLENSRNSTLREQIVEYKIISEMLIYSASKGDALEIIRAEHDSFGYDIVLKKNNDVRFIQLKARKGKGKTKSWCIHNSLIKNQRGTVLLANISYQDNNIELDYKVLPFKKNIKELWKNKNKDIYRKVKESDLKKIQDIVGLLEFLFKKSDKK